ncbi:uncharacterized protein LOC121857282 [Homarus americanus]|uniref:uncharacterized protein LOC121857282 n=1 Tax=Homarus americanus TaxID=6706 RepID=UPI001C48AF37|nr:uncharacterized protein LOC121857282 [Homarus americanus]
MVCEDNSDMEVGEKDHDMGEVHVSSETMAKRANLAGKVASLQRRFEVPPRTAYGSLPTSSASVDNRQLLPRSNNSNVGHELHAKLAQALEENDKISTLNK